MQYIKGDLIQLAQVGNFEVIAHGCNCMCTMGAGIAKTIKLEFPEAYAADCATEKGVDILPYAILYHTILRIK